MATKFNPSFLRAHIDKIIEMLSFGKYYKLNAKVEEIEQTKKDIFVTVDNDGNNCYLHVPNNIIGNDHDEEEFVENLIQHAH